ncbi:transcriptional regulator [Scheffersomyces xylosifermentans]|uniref:transcriptional regulator n=1 Tax=Scheffersomyces xylosifermentans TaxID=1304137 RepID=UPI00315DAF1C
MSGNSIYNTTNSPATPSKPSEQKRRRVTRACDNCRQKKVKCDGKQPCIHCTVYSYKCTYDQPNIRNKKNSGIPIPSSQPSAAVLQVAAAAAAAAAAKEVSASLYPQKNLIMCQNILKTLLPKLKINCFDQNFNFDFEKFQKAYSTVVSKSGGTNTIPSLNEISDLYSDNNLNISSPNNTSVVSKHERQSSVSSAEETPLGQEIKLYLPKKEITLQLIYITWNKACVLFRFYHRPSLLEEVDLLYSLDPYNYGDRQQKFLPFLYSILACGSLFSKSATTSAHQNENFEDDGFKYFLEARKLIDISNVGDISSIQTIVMMIMYLQCSARLSTCYSYIGIALRSALKEGLHRNLSIFHNSRRKLDPIEVDTRKRLFYTIYKMDIYINSLLGLPRSINEDEFDQDFPEELDDENITRTEYLYSAQQGRLSSSACANHHTKLMLILSHIIKKLYPIKVKTTSKDTPLTPDRIHTKVTELELELKTWLDNLPEELKPTDPNDINSGKNIPEKFVLANYYLHLAFLNCQIMLYRPFIHFISDGPNNFQTSDPRSLIRGRNCIKVARMVVKLANKMIDQNLLVGTYWFSMYTIFFSIACLIYYFHFANYNNTESSGVNYAGVLFDDDLNIDMIKKDIEIGKKVLDCLKNNSNASLRIFNILNTLFEQLNRRTATTSRFRNNRVADPYIITNNLQNENVQTTFKNFDKMNPFAKSDSQKPEGEDTNGVAGDAGDKNKYAPYSQQNPPVKQESLGQLFSDASLATFTSGVDLANSRNDTEPIDNSHPPPPPPINNDSMAASVSMGSEEGSNSTQVDYMPGVFDKLDAQIFGRILPPYMLEKNAQRSAVHQYPNDPTRPVKDKDKDISLRGGSYQTQIPSPLNEQASQFSQINLEDFDFSSLGDPSNLEYLDPFNPIVNESPMNR